MGAYAPINGPSMYYEEHGQGRPFVLLRGDVAGLPKSRLAVLPGTTHITLVQRPSG